MKRIVLIILVTIFSIFSNAYAENIETQELLTVKEAAENGEADSQYNLGLMYYGGNGVNRNYREAVKWYLEAAEQGHAEAQYESGFMYCYGIGVEQDDREAVKWCRKAAEQGHAAAQFFSELSMRLDMVLSRMTATR